MTGATDTRNTREEYSVFHEAGSFYGIWILVVLIGVHTLAHLRKLLEPLLWAFFIMMGLLPLTDTIESLLLRACHILPLPQSRRGNDSDSVGRTHGGQFSVVSQQPGPDPVGSSEKEEDSRLEESAGCSTTGCGCARMIAVILVIGIFTGTVFAFFYMIYESALHMHSDWDHFQVGAERISARLHEVQGRVPDIILQKVLSKALQSMEEVVNFLLQTLAEIAADLVVQIVMMLLYMVFWLCEPFHVGESVPAVFRQYIWLKSIASGSYAFCVWCLLHVLGVDLAIVFGLITFIFNFVPEVGPFLSMMLPMPVILFDGRLHNPVFKMLLALVGQLFLKFVFGNIIEVKLVERQDDMKMHPVIILFCVAFFGYIWGATGMLLSVPIMATFKESLHLVPVFYRDRVLILLEGDKLAPERYEKRRRLSRQREELDARRSGSDEGL